MSKIVLLDIDGVLTDGTVYIDAGGEESKRIAFDDIDAIFELKRHGVRIGFITGEDNQFTEYVKKRFAPDFFITGCKDKLQAVKRLISKNKLDGSDIWYLGDSKKDVPLLEFLPRSFAPGDADSEAKTTAKTILKANRGQGAVKELARYILSPDSTLSRFWMDRLDEHISVIKSIRNAPELLVRISEVARVLAECLANGHKVLICGNGGSAADAQHIAAELVNRFLRERPGLQAEALTVDTSVLTAIANDYDFALVFSRQVEAKGKSGDVLLAISTSGQAKNVINAVLKAKEIGMKTIALSGRATTQLTRNADYCINVPSRDTPRIQEAHILILHLLCEYVETELFGKEKK